MGAICEVLTGRATNPAALTAVTVNTGDTLAARYFGEGVQPTLRNIWTQQATAGIVRARSNRMHDNVQGLRMVANAANPTALMPLQSEQRIAQTDQITLEIQGGGAEVDAAAILMYYKNVSNSLARLAMWEQIRAMVASILSVQVDVAGPATSGDWSAGTAITNFSNLLKAGGNYAVLGYTLDTASLAVALQGPDTANYRIGGPGVLDPVETRDWFVRLSQLTGEPHIPVIQAQNDGATRAFVARVGAGGTINVTFVLAELTGTV